MISGADPYFPCREIEEIRVLSQEESGIRSPVSRDSVDYGIHVLAAVMP